MATKQEIFEKIQALLQEKTGPAKPCPVCGQINWLIADKYVRLHASRDPSLVTTEEKLSWGFPLQPIICMTCGNTVLLNLLVLGVPDEEMKSIVYPEENANADGPKQE